MLFIKIGAFFEPQSKPTQVENWRKHKIFSKDYLLFFDVIAMSSISISVDADNYCSVLDDDEAFADANGGYYLTENLDSYYYFRRSFDSKELLFACKIESAIERSAF